MRISLIVIRSEKPKALSEFYEKFGLVFNYHKHGNGPYHYSAKINGVILEVYPLLKFQKEIDKGLRIGFELQDIEAIEKLLIDDEIEVIRYPEETEWGKRCIIKDIEGRKIELTIEK